QRLVQDGAQGPDVGERTDVLAALGLFRGHVGGRAQDRAGLRQVRVGVEQPGQAEVGDLRDQAAEGGRRGGGGGRGGHLGGRTAISGSAPRRNFRATRRFRAACSAAKTTPMPPRPRARSSRNPGGVGQSSPAGSGGGAAAAPEAGPSKKVVCPIRWVCPRGGG